MPAWCTFTPEPAAWRPLESIVLSIFMFVFRPVGGKRPWLAQQKGEIQAQYVTVIIIVAFELRFACIALSQGLNTGEVDC